MNLKNLLLLALLVSVSFVACNDDDDPEIPNEEELITTVTYTLVPNGGGSTVVFNFSDPDGDGGEAPVITGGSLEANKSYAGSLVLLNESESPAEDITEEIKEEDAEHQFFFTSTKADVSVSYADQDGDGNPLGLSSILTTQSAGSGNLTIILRHEPDKNAAGVSAGDITNAGGETDIEVTFPFDVQ